MLYSVHHQLKQVVKWYAFKKEGRVSLRRYKQAIYYAEVTLAHEIAERVVKTSIRTVKDFYGYSETGSTKEQ